MQLLSVEEARAFDEEVVKKDHIPLVWLMENAGRGVSDVVSSLHNEGGAKGDILFVLGTGNNGADGLVAMRQLLSCGIRTKCMIVGERDCGSALFLEQLRALEGLPLTIQYPYEEGGFSWSSENWIGVMRGASFIVEGLVGTGVEGALRQEIQQVILAMNECRDEGAKIISIDIPAGVSGNTGTVQPVHVQADVTVAMVAPKQGMMLYPAKEACGEIVVKSIGYPNRFSLDESALFSREGVSFTYAVEEADLREIFPVREATNHKGSHGHVLVVGGETTMVGATVMTSSAAVYAGAGKVTLAMDSAIQKLAMLKVIPEVMVAEFSIDTIAVLVKNKDVLAIGPGWGRSAQREKALKGILRAYSGPVVLDADALFALGDAKKSTLSEWKGRDIPAILTPHVGEFSRLSGFSVKAIESNRIELARAFAMEHQCVLVLKGAPTVVATPEGTVFVNTTGNPGMGTGGMGDVLTGMIAAYLGQGLLPVEASVLAVYLHGKSGDILAKERIFGFTPTEVAEMVGKVSKEMMLGAVVKE